MKKEIKIGGRYQQLFSMNGITTNVVAFLNPWIPLWWSASFPGFGHFLIGNTVTGFVLVLFEFTFNNFAQVNNAIYHSMLGDFSGAKEVLNLRWFFGYIGVYLFAMYDSYRRTVEYNKFYVLSYRYTQNVNISDLSPVSKNEIDITSPVMGMFWSFITPGLGSQFTNRLPTFFFSLTWWCVTIYQSRWLEGIYYTAVGDFLHAKAVLDPQWLLFIPSLMTFTMYFSYKETVKGNKQFKLSQTQYLRAAYQSEHFEFPLK
jgi:hypothetical protein